MVCEHFDVFDHSSNVGEIAFEQFRRGVACLFAFSVQLAVAAQARGPKMDKLVTVLEANVIHL